MKKYSLVVFDWYEILFQFTQIVIGFAGTSDMQALLKCKNN